MNDYAFKVINVDTGDVQPAGQAGELWVRGYAVMQGYWDRPEATAETLDADGLAAHRRYGVRARGRHAGVHGALQGHAQSRRRKRLAG